MIKKSLWSQSFGVGEPMFLIHGMGSASTAWKPIISRVSKHFQVITVDLPGHGNSPLIIDQKMDPQSLANSILELADAHGFEKFHLVGNSLGGWVSLELASMAPKRVKSVIALAPAGLWLTPYTSRIPGSAGSKIVASALQHIAPNLLKFSAVRKIGFGSVSPKWQELPIQTCIDAAIAMGKSPGYFLAWDALLKKRFDKDISPDIPVTIIFGDSDNTLPERTCQERSLAPDHSKWIVLSNCGHAPMWDQPEQVSAEILATSGKSK